MSSSPKCRIRPVSKGGVEELCVHEILKLMEGVHHSPHERNELKLRSNSIVAWAHSQRPFVHFVVFLAIEEQDRRLLPRLSDIDLCHMHFMFQEINRW